MEGAAAEDIRKTQLKNLLNPIRNSILICNCKTVRGTGTAKKVSAASARDDRTVCKKLRKWRTDGRIKDITGINFE